MESWRQRAARRSDTTETATALSSPRRKRRTKCGNFAVESAPCQITLRGHTWKAHCKPWRTNGLALSGKGQLSDDYLLA